MSNTGGAKQPWRDLLLLALVLGAAAAVYAQVGRFEFVNWDDPAYVTDNPQVRAGLTLAGARWAFTTFHEANWHPLTWLSLMLDASLFGARPAGFHVVNLLLHLAATALLFLFLRQATGAGWRSAFAAGLFALHPLHVESVAWVSERKDTLSAVLFMLVLLAYRSYARRPRAGAFFLVALLFALGLMAKPMLVTLPLVLLLLDRWPLGRGGAGGDRRPAAGWPRLVLEKVPLLALSAASAAVTIAAQRRGGALGSAEAFPIGERAANACVAAASYLGKTLWPANLSPFYPLPPAGWPASTVALAALVLLALTGLALAGRRSRPWLLCGWLWYLAMLLPVSGLVQVGLQAMADRYTYLPLIGVFIAIAWSLPFPEQAAARSVTVPLAALALASLAVASAAQAGYWSDGERLFRRALAAAPDSAVARDHLGVVLFERGRTDEAIAEYARAIALDPGYASARIDLANALRALGRYDEGIVHAREALRLAPGSAAHLALGTLLMQTGREPGARGGSMSFHPAAASGPAAAAPAEAPAGSQATTEEEAELHLREAVRLDPGSAAARNNLGVLLARAGRFDEAIAQFEQVLELEPDDAGARGNLERTRLLKGAGSPP